MAYQGTNSVRPGPKEKAEGAISFRGSPPTEGPGLVFKANRLDPGNPDPPHGYDLDPAIEPIEAPDKGKDTYTGIPGDGIVPG